MGWFSSNWFGANWFGSNWFGSSGSNTIIAATATVQSHYAATITITG